MFPCKPKRKKNATFGRRKKDHSDITVNRFERPFHIFKEQNKEEKKEEKRKL